MKKSEIPELHLEEFNQAHKHTARQCTVLGSITQGNYSNSSYHSWWLFYQLDRLVLKQGVVHCLYSHENLEYHQLVLPQRFHSKILRSVHDDMGHQGLEKLMQLLKEWVYWPTIVADTTKWGSHCTGCQVAQGNYITPKPKICHLEYNNPMDLLCLDFMKINPSRTIKENVLVIMDAFSKFMSQAAHARKTRDQEMPIRPNGKFWRKLLFIRKCLDLYIVTEINKI